MRALLAFAAILLAGALPTPAAGHDEYNFRHERVRLTDAQQRRVAALDRRATAAGIRRFAPAGLARAVAWLGDCRRAEQIMRGVPYRRGAAFEAFYSTATGPDRACAERALATVAADARRLGPEGIDAADLYAAGILWRRFGDEEQARAAIDEAERLYDAEEAGRGDDLWSCHGGYCITARWFTRLNGLRLLHGTAQWRGELARLVALAAPGIGPSRDAPPALQIGQRVFDELVTAAAMHDEEAVGLAAARGTMYRDARAYHAARMHALLAEGRTQEAMALLPRAGAAFSSNDPELVAENFDAFVASKDFLTRLGVGFDAFPVQLVRALLDLGELDRAARVAAQLREGAGRRTSPIRGADELVGLTAFIAAPEAPVARLAQSAPAEGRDLAFTELALFLASRGRWDEFEAAFAQVREPDYRSSLLVDLPCRAAAAGEAAAIRAVRRAGSIRDPDGDVPRLGYEGSSNQAYLCLLRRGYGEAAYAYLQALEPVRARFDLASNLPIWSSLAGSARVRRRQADLAFALAERHGLWEESAALTLALEYELLGDHDRVDRIVARIEDREERARLLVRLIESYVPLPQRARAL